MSYTPTIGLEIHAELKTRTKMFCDSRNDPFAAEANMHICPVCMAHPGTLPVVNHEAVRHVLRVGVALSAELADYTEFDRKNYFYPDLPKGYQLSQYEYPLASGGELAGVSITRVHLEEDTASSIHASTSFDEAQDKSLSAGDEGGTTLVDYNRAGVPLMELVTEPVIHSAEDASRFAQELQLLLRHLGVSDAHMEKGEMRVEANVSISRSGLENSQRPDLRLGTKVEIKNLNSFNAMERAVNHEIERQRALLEKGELVSQETRGWDEAKQATFVQRLKEGSADYRYFPDPDIPSLRLSELPELSEEALRGSLGELPWIRRARYMELGVKREDAEAFVQDARLGRIFDSLSEILPQSQLPLASNYLANDVVALIRDTDNRDTDLLDISGHFVPRFASLIGMLAGRTISSRTAKDLLVKISGADIDPAAYAAEHNLLISTDTGAAEAIIEKVISGNAPVVADYRAGKLSALEYLVGQCMKELRGAGDAEALRDSLRARLS